MTKKIKLLNIMSLFQNSLLFKLKDAFSLVSLALTTVLFYSTANFAADTVEVTEAEPLKIYDVEIIVFKNSSVPMGRELNLPTPSPSRTELTLDLLNPDNDEINAEKGFFTLLPEEARLQDIVQHIKKSSRYKLLIHTGWRQPGLDKENGLPVWIKGGQNFGNGYSSIDQSEPILIEPVLNKPVPEEPVPVESEQKRLTTLESPSSDSSEPEKEPGGLYELEGQIIITLSRYLHTQANLVLRKPATILNLIEQSSTPPDQNAAELSAEEDPVDVLADNRLLNYGLNEKRRMRSKRLHYLDNPQFGMLVMITPYEAPEEVTTIEETSPNLEETAKEQDSQ
ncbi:MAG: hypothetical protein GY744_10210 [Gammaproteobacteria bacterium]|nr:hypothetical protein [Gammaproteobacteria bacterium]